MGEACSKKLDTAERGDELHFFLNIQKLSRKCAYLDHRAPPSGQSIKSLCNIITFSRDSFSGLLLLIIICIEIFALFEEVGLQYIYNNNNIYNNNSTCSIAWHFLVQFTIKTDLTRVAF